MFKCMDCEEGYVPNSSSPTGGSKCMTCKGTGKVKNDPRSEKEIARQEGRIDNRTKTLRQAMIKFSSLTPEEIDKMGNISMFSFLENLPVNDELSAFLQNWIVKGDQA